MEKFAKSIPPLLPPRKKTLIVTLTGKHLDKFRMTVTPVTREKEYRVTGSRLSIRRAEAIAVNEFCKEFNLCCGCGLTSKIL